MNTITVRTTAATLLSAVFSVFLSFAGNLTSVPALFSEQAALYPQEKLYVQTDKPYYIVEEDVWFRAFLADNMSLIPDTTSRYVYGELVSPIDTVVTRVKVRPVNGVYSGYIHLDESLRRRLPTSFLHAVHAEYRRRILLPQTHCHPAPMDMAFALTSGKVKLFS